MNIILRKADENDFPVIISLIKEFSVFQKKPERVTITLEQMIKDKNNFQCIVAVIKKEIVGFTTFFFTYYSWTGKGLYIDDLYVKESFRKQAIGTKLLGTIIDLAKDKQCKNVRWLVSNWNLNAIDFYKNMGATIDEVDLNCNFQIEPD